MTPRLILASSSEIRARLLAQAGLAFDTEPARIDEVALRAGMDQEDLSPRDQADFLAEMKAQKIAARHPSALVLGCDQILCCDGQIFGKSPNPEIARAHLQALQSRRHTLFSALVLYDQGRPVWRHVGTAHLTMRPLSEDQIATYIDRNWNSVQSSVGGYKIEEAGIRLFTRIDGDTFSILGLPLLPLLSYLIDRGLIDP